MTTAEIKTVPTAHQAPAQASFTAAVTVEIDGRRVPVQIHTPTLNDLRKTLRGLIAANMLVEDAPVANDAAPIDGKLSRSQTTLRAAKA